MEKRKILIISSISPLRSANLGLDVISSLKKVGYEVDFITQYAIPSLDIISVKEEIEPKLPPPSLPYIKKQSFFRKLASPFFPKKKLVWEDTKPTNKFVIVNSDETHPPIDPQLIVNKIHKKYNFAIVFFWEGMLTAHSLESIYKKINVPIFILAVDMFPFTGGCFYFWDCRNFITSRCSNCPGIKSQTENDASKYNFIYKQHIYQNIKCIFLGNKWMKSYIERSPIIASKPVRDILLVVDEDVFKIREKGQIYREFNIKRKKGMFIFFAGAPGLSENRKGFKYLVQSINCFAQTLTKKEKSKIILLLAGHTNQEIESYFDIQVYKLGFLNSESLAKAYNLADAYISPSIEDAGPSMVNQAIMSGTPVIAFNTGVAQDIVITGQTGYNAKHLDIVDFTKGLHYIYSMSQENRNIIQQNCRKLGLKEFSLTAFGNKIRKYDLEFCQQNMQ